MANLITISRLFIIPIFLYYMFLSPPQNLIAAVIFGIAAATDALDGYVARNIGKVTELGKVMDPLVDRIFIVVTIIALYMRDAQPPLFALIILIGREIFLLLGYVFLRKKEIKIPVSLLGKTATAFLMTSFAFLILKTFVGFILFYIGLILYIVSLFYYLKEAIKVTS